MWYSPFIDIVANSSYIVTLAKYLLVERKGMVSVVVHKDSTAEDILKSYIHALVMVNLTVEQKSLHLECQSWMDKHYESFVQKVISMKIFQGKTYMNQSWLALQKWNDKQYLVICNTSYVTQTRMCVTWICLIFSCCYMYLKYLWSIISST